MVPAQQSPVLFRGFYEPQGRDAVLQDLMKSAGYRLMEVLVLTERGSRRVTLKIYTNASPFVPVGMWYEPVSSSDADRQEFGEIIALLKTERYAAALKTIIAEQFPHYAVAR